jgi:hypothetical protein
LLSATINAQVAAALPARAPSFSLSISSPPKRQPSTASSPVFPAPRNTSAPR